MSDQPMPTEGRQDVYPVARQMFDDMLAQRTAQGIRTYGVPLSSHNGRNPYQDAMEELIDAWQYLIQASLEHDDLLAENAALRAQLAATAAPSGGEPAS